MVEIAVEDSGMGVNEDMRKLLFQKYHTSLEVVCQGNGIGLSLCKNILTLLNGDIWLDDTYDSGIPGFPGARFVVKLNKFPLVCTTEIGLPSSDADTENVDTSSSGVTPVDSRGAILPETMSVLFVDDDSILRKLFMRSLRRAYPGWTIEGAANGEAALEMATSEEETRDVESQTSARHNRYDLIFGKFVRIHIRPHFFLVLILE